MKSSIHVERHATTPPASTWPSTLRLGLVVSAVAALVTVVVNSLADVPTIVILIPVVVIAFALSWHATGQVPGDDQP